MISRRLLLASALAVPALVPPAMAQGFPDRPVTLIIPQSPGSVADLMARVVAPAMSENLGQPVVIVNRPGADGVIAAQELLRSRPDGHTLFIGSVSTHGLNAGIYPKLPYDPVRDFSPIGQIADSPLVIVIDPRLPAQTAAEFIALVKAEPTRFSYGSAGPGSGSRFTAELFRRAVGIEIQHVPYRSPAEAVLAVMAGQVALAVPSVPSTPAYIRAGQLRPLAVTSAKRAELLPDVPTTAELGFPEVAFTSWTGVFGPAGVPAPVVQRLHAALAESLRRPNIRKGITDLGATPVDGSTEDFASFVRSEADRLTRGAREAGMRVE